eukprot:4042321-Pleurochrysis_carterae.AAC.1
MARAMARRSQRGAHWPPPQLPSVCVRSACDLRAICVRSACDLRATSLVSAQAWRSLSVAHMCATAAATSAKTRRMSRCAIGGLRSNSPLLLLR